jgi:hypothetical protein
MFSHIEGRKYLLLMVTKLRKKTYLYPVENPYKSVGMHGSIVMHFTRRKCFDILGGRDGKIHELYHYLTEKTLKLILDKIK